MVDTFCESSVLPLNYINVSDDVLLSDFDKVTWVKMIKLLSPNEFIYEPLQFVRLHSTNELNNRNEKVITKSAVSTGTASHENVERSLENALIECIQMDSYNLWWYGGYAGKDISIDVQEFMNSYFKNGMDEFFSKFEVKFTDISFDKSIWVIVCEIIGKNNQRPRYTVGVQGAYDRNRAIYRSFMETLAVLSYSINLSWLSPESLVKSSEHIGKMNNLDKNVAYYVVHDKPDINHRAFTKWNTSKVNNLETLIYSMSNLLKWCGYLNITPNEFDGMSVNVSRIVAPMLLPVALPSFPPKKHPRYMELGGIINNVEHPMA
ncbi:MAG: YcaO-like family protein [Lactobacillaceae bacterium]|jgi:thiazole/oxazole-forming peptide maturase SagD family component|nr:YcaO-like family protein [Lactobacillaceae bacterium]